MVGPQYGIASCHPSGAEIELGGGIWMVVKEVGPFVTLYVYNLIFTSN
jgi:hypothetical protein